MEQLRQWGQPGAAENLAVSGSSEGVNSKAETKSRVHATVSKEFLKKADEILVLAT